MTKLPKKIAVIGLGLIGGSIFLGLKKRLSSGVEIKAVKRGDKLPLDCGLIVIATPISEIIKLLTRLDKVLTKKTLVMDVGSTKEAICNHASGLKNNNLVFVGTHPMAGREVSGFANSDPNLFMNKSWIVTRSLKTDRKNVTMVCDLVKILGALPVIMDPAKHDELVAVVSDLPLLTGSLLINTVFSQKDKTLIARLASTGFRDTTRLASFSPSIKTEIVSTNRKNLLSVLSYMEKEIQAVKSLIEMENWRSVEEYFRKVKQTRDSWIKNYFS